MPSTDTVYVCPPRHPAEELTGARLQVPQGDQAVVHMPLPHDLPPSLAHLAVAIDTAAGQAAARLQPDPGRALRTLSLNAQLCADLRPGSWVHVRGRARAHQRDSILTTCEVFDQAGDLVALGTCRFIVVDVARATITHRPPVALDRSAIPASWDDSLGLGAQIRGGSPAAPGASTAREAAPKALTENGSAMVHGGVQVRALELGMRSSLQTSPDPLSDLAVVFHRPVPSGADTGLQVHSRVSRRGRRVAVANASLVGAGQKLLSSAEGIFTTGHQA